MRNGATIVAVCCMASSLVAGCEKSRWVAVPPMLLTCEDLTPDFQQDISDRNKYSLARGMLQNMCQQTGAKDFGGAARCPDKVVEVKCVG